MGQIMQYRYYPTLSLLYITIVLATIVMAYKTLAFSHFIFPGGILIFPFSYFLIGAVVEMYGYRMARQLILVGFLCQFIFVILLTLINKLPSPQFWQHQAAYDQVIDPLLRCVISINIGSALGEWLNSYFISKWRKQLKGKYFWLRCIGGNIVGETVLSITTFTLAFSGVMPARDLLNLTISAWLFKVFYTIIIGVFGGGFILHLKDKENVNAFSTDSINPFAIHYD